MRRFLKVFSVLVLLVGVWVAYDLSRRALRNFEALTPTISPDGTRIVVAQQTIYGDSQRQSLLRFRVLTE